MPPKQTTAVATANPHLSSRDVMLRVGLQAARLLGTSGFELRAQREEKQKRLQRENSARQGPPVSIAHVRLSSGQYLPFPAIQKSAKTSRSSLRQLNTGRPRAGVKGLFKRQRP
jgi:hypothetical protein